MLSRSACNPLQFVKLGSLGRRARLGNSVVATRKSFLTSRHFFAAAIASACLFSLSLRANSEGRSPDIAQLSTGEEFQPCADCPTFVRVPAAPDELRRIQFVSKFELTWRNYLRAVKDGSCIVANRNASPSRKSQPDQINPHLDRFEIDWPITVLGPADVDCYIDWLNKKTSLSVAVPTYDEWKWFASSGRPSVRYPWGNDPKQAVEALTGLQGEPFESDIDARYPDGSNTTGREHYFYLRYLYALKVGQFPPSPWGLHDLMGNAPELTSDIEPHVRNDGRSDESFSVTIVGGGFYDKRWVEEGIGMKSYYIQFDDQYSGYPAVRLVLVE